MKCEMIFVVHWWSVGLCLDLLNVLIRWISIDRKPGSDLLPLNRYTKWMTLATMTLCTMCTITHLLWHSLQRQKTMRPPNRWIRPILHFVTVNARLTLPVIFQGCCPCVECSSPFARSVFKGIVGTYILVMTRPWPSVAPRTPKVI